MRVATKSPGPKTSPTGPKPATLCPCAKSWPNVLCTHDGKQRRPLLLIALAVAAVLVLLLAAADGTWIASFVDPAVVVGSSTNPQQGTAALTTAAAKGSHSSCMSLKAVESPGRPSPSKQSALGGGGGAANVPKEDFRTTPGGSPEMAAQRQAVDDYVASQAFKDRVAEMKELQPRGILINSGGRLYVTNLVVLLKVLRHHLNCSLPVEVVWHSPEEMDDATLAALKANFGPLTGFDVSTMPYPKHHRRPASLQKYEGKVLSLLFSSFQEVLMLDSDSMPLRDPTYMFEDAQYKQHGNLFWPDIFDSWLKEEAFPAVGLHKQVKDVLNRGKAFAGGRGHTTRNTESGQLLLNRVQHADVMEYLVWINSFSDVLYNKVVWGDKDTFSLAFAVAGKAHWFSQVSVSSGGVFQWAERCLLVKSSGVHEDGYHLMGQIQFDRFARPFTIHRTDRKWKYPDSQQNQISILTPPLPIEWALYYISLDALGPTKGVNWQYNAPASAFNISDLSAQAQQHASDKQPSSARRQLAARKQAGQCPGSMFHQQWRLRELGLPMDDLRAGLGADCKGELAAIGTRYESAHTPGHLCKDAYMKYPQLTHITEDRLESISTAAAQALAGNGTDPPPPPPVPAVEYSDALPLSALHESYKAYQWTLKNVRQFPIIQSRR